MTMLFRTENSAARDLNFVTSLRRYLLVGVIATAIDWALFSIFIFILDWHYLPAAIIAFVIATFAGYLWGLRLVFTGGRHRRSLEIGLVYLASAFGLAIHTGVLFVLVDWVGTHVLVAKLAATAANFLWNFCTRYFWIFSRDDSVEQ